MKDIYVVAAKRTPFGRYKGYFKDRSAIDLGVMALAGTLKASSIPKEKIQALFMGNAISAGLGQNMARQVALRAGLPQTAVATTINEVCGSSIKALRLAQGQMLLGDLDLVAVGGAESMTNAPYVVAKSNQSDPADHMKSTLFQDGIDDAFSGQPMGITAENVAAKYHITREEMDRFSLSSHRKAVKAVRSHAFKDEIIPLLLNSQALIRDENIRSDTSLAKLAKLKPAFKKDGLVTAGSSSPISDGASMVILATGQKCQELHLKPLAKLGAYAEAGFDPALMGYTPFFAVKKLLRQTGHQISDYDAIEINEAFAASTIAVARDLKVPADKLNILGGALALGHPLGATGTRLVATALSALRQVGGQKALITLCMGGGQAIAYEIERV